MNHTEIMFFFYGRGFQLFTYVESVVWIVLLSREKRARVFMMLSRINIFHFIQLKFIDAVIVLNALITYEECI